MARMVNCIKLGTESQGLDAAPFPGELGEKIYNNISRAAWDQWTTQQTMLINEYRLNLREAEAREFLRKEAEKFFFGEN